MIPINPIAVGQSQLPAVQVQAVDVYVPPAASQNETGRPVSTPTANPEVQNNTRGGNFSATTSTATTPTSAPVTLTSGAFISPIPAALNATGGVSPFFFAQLLGQGLTGDSQPIVVDYESALRLAAANRNQPQQTQTARPTLLNAFQQVLQDQSAQPKLLPSGIVQQAANNNSPVTAEVSKTLAALFPLAGKPATPRPAALEAADRREQPSAIKGSKSLINQRGSNAYFATDVRNILELEIVPAANAVA